MVASAEHPIDLILSELGRYAQDKFTGKVTINLTAQKQWVLYLSIGRLVWAMGGKHPVRRWRRHLLKHCPQINPGQMSLRQNDLTECWDYNILVLLVRRQLSQTDPVLSTIQGIVGEVVFDILQNASLIPRATSAIPAISIQEAPGVRPSHLGVLQNSVLELEGIVDKVQRQWQQWEAAGLKSISPNVAPVINSLAELEEETSPMVYKNLVTLITGKRTLRDLAWMMKQDTIDVTRSLVPYIQQRIIGLHSLPDLPTPSFLTPPSNTVTLPQERRRPTPTPPPKSVHKALIACVDDSPQTRQVMEEIFTEAGYGFLPIADSLNALPLLIQYKPQLIFLDLVMPIANGYELCAQIRRVAQLENTPVIILTGRDGIVDRVRAKMVGANDFMSKPIDAERILKTVQRFVETIR
ncbi:response regulator [Spirulina subsalsa FACHB-351]|uniref:Response regulator n=1 Tax=Spirulina subsalsa FACHB-351 TaxID=234711 RepID=A0ABT3LAB8_9CYAN|nr:response regulator [Spirulina subsalsa]MCW6038433.1 response regulator [Spirulina subsalsa FACHB-351]